MTSEVKGEIRDFLIHVGRYYKGDLEFFFKEVPDRNLITNTNYYDVLTGACQEGNEVIIKQVLERYNPQWKQGRNPRDILLYDLFVHNLNTEIIELFINKFIDVNNLLPIIKFDRVDLFFPYQFSEIKRRGKYTGDEHREIYEFYSSAFTFKASKIMKFIQEELKGIKSIHPGYKIDFSEIKPEVLRDYEIEIILSADPDPFSFINLKKDYSSKIINYQAERNHLNVVKYYLEKLQLVSMRGEFQDPEIAFSDIFLRALFYYFPIEASNFLRNHFFCYFLIRGGWDNILDTLNEGIWNYDMSVSAELKPSISREAADIGKGWYNKMIHDNDDYIIRYLKQKGDQKTLDYLASWAPVPPSAELSEFEKKHNL